MGVTRHRPRRLRVLVTCEHGGNRVPAEYRDLFRGAQRLLDSHRGYDAGAIVLARELAAALDAPLVAATVSRLVVELNRSPSHPALYSERTKALTGAEKERLIARYYTPYRAEVEERVRETVAAGARLFHFSSHSFTPVLDGEVRRADIGLLYDPRRPLERAFCARWSAALAAHIAPLRVRRNYPYRGNGDGLTTFLRRRFGASDYAGIEIEVNQKHVFAGGAAWRALRREILQSVAGLLRNGQH